MPPRGTSPEGPRCRMVAQGSVEDNASPSATRADPLPSCCRPARPLLLAPPLAPPPAPGAPAAAATLLTRFHPFRSERDFRLIVATSAMLETSGFYWGAMAVDEAHARLRGEPPGTFLVRDSRRSDVFFTLSYRSAAGPVSVRVELSGSRFSLSGSRESFDSLFKLLEHYAGRRSLTKPYRKVRLRSLQELCRQRIVEACGGERVASIPVNPILRDFLLSFPYTL